MSVPSCRVLQISQPPGKHLWEQIKLWGASGRVPAEKRGSACLFPVFITEGSLLIRKEPQSHKKVGLRTDLEAMTV